MRILLLLQAVLSALPLRLYAQEIWRCDGSGAPIYTNTPVRSTDSACSAPELPPLVRAPHLIDSLAELPLGSRQNPVGQNPGNPNSGDREQHAAVNGRQKRGSPVSSVPMRSVARGGGEGASLRQGAPKRHQPVHLSFEAREREPALRHLPSQCTLVGSVAAAEKGPAVLRIRRGGARIDEVPLLLRGSYRNQSWKAVLKGGCRNTVVELVQRPRR